MPIAHDAILKSMSDGVIVLDEQQRIIELNPAARKIISREKSEVIGRYNKALPGQLSLLEIKPDMTETEAIISLGQGLGQHFYGVHITPISTNQKLSGHLVILHDNTEQVKAESESRERVILETELNERKRAAEAIQGRLELKRLLPKYPLVL